MPRLLYEAKNNSFLTFTCQIKSWQLVYQLPKKPTKVGLAPVLNFIRCESQSIMETLSSFIFNIIILTLFSQHLLLIISNDKRCQMEKEMLEKIYAAQVSILGLLIRIDKKKSGISTTSDCIEEAIQMIKKVPSLLS